MPAQSVLLESTDIAREDVIQTLSSWTTSAMLSVQVDTSTELMLLVLLNVQLVMFLMVAFVNLFHNHAHQVNSSTHKLEHVLLVNHHAHNVNTVKTIVLHALLDIRLLQASALNQTAVVLENSELPQVHVLPAHQNVKNVSVLKIVPLVLQDTFSTELIALLELPT